MTTIPLAAPIGTRHLFQPEVGEGTAMAIATRLEREKRELRRANEMPQPEVIS